MSSPPTLGAVWQSLFPRLAGVVLAGVVSGGCADVLGIDSTTQRDAGGTDSSTEFSPNCGNATRDPGEDCDDGNAIDDGNGCDARCKKNAVCGDDKVQPLFEACDDGNNGDDTCSADCTLLTFARSPAASSGAVDITNDGKPDFFQDTSSGFYVVSGDTAFGRRVAFEVDTRDMPSGPLLKAAYLSFSACCETGETPFKLYGYVGNGTIEFVDFNNSGKAIAFKVVKDAPTLVDVTSFLQETLRAQSQFAGFLLRAEQQTTISFSIYSPTSGMPDKFPRFLALYCVDADRNNLCD